MKNILKSIGNYLTTMGWVGLPASIMRLDLQQHAMVGLWLAIPGYILPHFTLGFEKFTAFLIAVGLSTIVGVGKELRDKITGKGTPDVLDAVATIGATVVASIILIIFR